ncbi:MAG: hypothetical protein ACRDP7_45935 [Trebonia sp.]
MTHATVSHLPGRRGPRPVPGCTAAASPLSHPADAPVRDVASSAAQLADAWRLWTCTRQPGALHDVQRHLADIVLAACTAAYLTDPDGTEGEPAPAA